jgi:hypothetical protein
MAEAAVVAAEGLTRLAPIKNEALVFAPLSPEFYVEVDPLIKVP